MSPAWPAGVNREACALLTSAGLPRAVRRRQRDQRGRRQTGDQPAEQGSDHGVRLPAARVVSPDFPDRSAVGPGP